jgi:hypothetical protein
MPAIKDMNFPGFDDTYDVYYYGDIIMYRFQYNYDSIINGQTVLRERRPDFFVFHRDSSFGQTFYAYVDDGNIPGRHRVDSIIRLRTFPNSQFDTLANMKPDSSYVNANGDLVKIFNPEKRKHDPVAATIYFYFTNKLKGVKESLSRKMDTVEGMKLFRIVVKSHPGYSEEYKVLLSPGDMFWEMKEIPIKNPDQVKGYFEKYKREHVKE